MLAYEVKLLPTGIRNNDASQSIKSMLGFKATHPNRISTFKLELNIKPGEIGRHFQRSSQKIQTKANPFVSVIKESSTFSIQFTCEKETLFLSYYFQRENKKIHTKSSLNNI